MCSNEMFSNEMTELGAALPPKEMISNEMDDMEFWDNLEKEEGEKLSSAIQEMKQIPSVMNMLKSMNLSPQAQTMLEQAIANAAIQFGGVQAFFASGNSLHDSPTTAKKPEPSLPTRHKPKQKRHPKAKRPHATATPTSVSDSCLKPAYHQPACANAKHQKKPCPSEHGAKNPFPVSTKTSSSQAKPAPFMVPSSYNMAPSSYHSPLSYVKKREKKATKHAPVKKDSYFHAYGSWYYRPKTFQIGAIVLYKSKNLQAKLSKVKYAPTYEGLYLVKGDNDRSRYDLATLDGKGLFRIHARFLQPWWNPVRNDHPFT